MTAAQLLSLQADVVDLLEVEGIITPAGAFVAVPYEKYADLAAKIVALFATHGVTVPPKVLKIISLLPLILQIAESFG